MHLKITIRLTMLGVRKITRANRQRMKRSLAPAAPSFTARADVVVTRRASAT